jgi:endonuclease III
MKRITGAAFLAISLLVSQPLSAQNPNEKEKEQLNALIKEVQAQQAAIAGNQTKIEAKLEALNETIREARLFSSRGGR